MTGFGPGSGRRPLLVAFASVALWALLLVVSRIVLVTWDVDPWSFTFVQLIAGGVVSIVASTAVVGGEASGEAVEAADWSSLRRVRTWLYGSFRVTTAAAFTAALAHTTVTYAGLLGTINLVLGVIGAAIVYGRWPGRGEYVGLALVAAGIALLVATRLDGGLRNPAVALMLVSELAVVGAALVAESHPDNAGESRTVRLRFSGVVLVLTASLFLALRLAQQAIGGGPLGATIDTSPSMWIAGIVVGVTLRGPAMYTALNATRLVGAEVYLMVTASLAFAGLLLETAAGALGVVDRPTFDAIDGLLLAIIACGAVSVFAARRRATARGAAATVT
ncbi:MAG: EamA family transporter [Actinomycetota bacterium]